MFIINPYVFAAGSTDILVVLLGHRDTTGGAATWPAGWTAFGAAIVNNTNIVGECRWKEDGGESSITITLANTSVLTYGVYRIRNHTGNPDGTGVSGGASTTTPDPPNHNPGVTRNFWVAATSWQADSPVGSLAYPTNYSDNRQTTGTANQTAIGMASRVTSATSENPGTFTIDTSRRSVSWTLGFPGASTVVNSKTTGNNTTNTSHSITIPAAV